MNTPSGPHGYRPDRGKTDNRAMRRVPVRSSALRSVGYDPRTLALEVEFESGEVYRYLDVSPEVVEGLIDAESKGAYLTEHIKPRYDVEHVDPADD